MGELRFHMLHGKAKKKFFLIIANVNHYLATQACHKLLIGKTYTQYL